jgi:archaellum component FlaD/FlaE
LMGFDATYESHVLEGFPLNRKSALLVHSNDRARLGALLGTPLGITVGLVVLHFFLHVAGQKNLTFLLVPGCFLLHLLTGFTATYESHVLEGLPSNRKSTTLVQPKDRARLGALLGTPLGITVGLVVLHFLLHVAGQKNLTFLPVPGCFFLHLLMGFDATYESHVLEGFPLNRKSALLVHSNDRARLGALLGTPLGITVGLVVLHFFLHVAGQKNLTFFPVPGCFLLHLLTGFNATYESHVLEGLPSNRKSTTLVQPNDGGKLGSGLGTPLRSRLGAELGPALGNEIGPALGNELGSALGNEVGPALGNELGPALGMELGAPLGLRLGAKLGSALGERLGMELGTVLVLGALLKLGIALGNELGSKLGTALGNELGSKLGTALGALLGSRLGFELGSIDVLGLELGKELGSSLGGKITVAIIPWSSSKSMANFPDKIATSLSSTAF